MLGYGSFLSSPLDFTIISFCIFIVIRQLQRLRLFGAPEAAGPTRSEQLLEEIRDELRKKN